MWIFKVTGYSEAEYKGKRNGKYWSPKFSTVEVKAATKEEAVEEAKKLIPTEKQAQFKVVQYVKIAEAPSNG